MRLLIMLLVVLIAVPLAIAQNVQYSENGNAKMQIYHEYPEIIESTGLTSELDYSFEEINEKWRVRYCHKNFKKNYQEKSLIEKRQYQSVPVRSMKGNVQTPHSIGMDRACSFFDIDVQKGDQIRIGRASTIIEINDINASFTVTPEYKPCSYRKCSSEIILQYSGNDTLDFHSDACTVSIEDNPRYSLDYHSHEKEVTFDDIEGIAISSVRKNMTVSVPTSDSVPISLSDGERVTFTLNAIMPGRDSFKYNVSCFFHGKNFTIDPFFITNETNFEEGSFNHTYVNESGFVQQNGSFEIGYYASPIFNGSNESTWETIDWWQEICYGCSLPNNKGTDTGHFIRPFSMDFNSFLLHMDHTTKEVTDSSGENHEGIGNNLSFSQVGIFNHSIAFNGNNSQIRFNDTGTSLDFNNTRNMTISFWIKPNDETSSMGIMEKSNGSNGFSLIRSNYLGFGPNSILFSITFTIGTGHVSVGDITENKFHHVVAQYISEGSNVGINIWLNNRKEQSILLPGAAVGNFDSPLVIGNVTNHPAGFSSLTRPSAHMDGFLDEIAIFNRALNDSEVQALYRRGVNKLQLEARKCDDITCSTNASFTAYENATAPFPVNISPSTFFQYRFRFSNNGTNDSAQLYNVSTEFSQFIDTIPPIVNLLLPENNTNQTNPINFNFEVFDESFPVSCILIVDNITLEGQTIPENGTYQMYRDVEAGNKTWNVNCTDANQNTGQGIPQIFSAFIPAPILAPGVCNAETGPVLLLGLLIVFALALVVIGFTSGRHFMTLFGGLMLLPVSLFVFGCSNMLGFLIMALGLLLIIFSGINSMGYSNSSSPRALR